jgi:hypothetical protein
MDVWNGHPREWRLSDECHGRSEWNDAAAALRLRWQSFRPSLEIKALIARMMPPHRRMPRLRVGLGGEPLAHRRRPTAMRSFLRTTLTQMGVFKAHRVQERR